MRTPRPWLLTILFFAIELNILVSVKRSRNYRVLLLLLPLFSIWANVHIQFVYGLFVLGLAALEGPINRMLRRQPSVDNAYDRPLPFEKMILLIALCICATLVNAYHFRIYLVLFDLIRQNGLYDQISELTAMDFRSLSDWIVVMLTLGAVFALGRQRGMSPFWLPLFVTAVFLSFRSKRDVWFISIVAITIISMARPKIETASRDFISTFQVSVVVLLCTLMLGIAIFVNKVTNSSLEKIVAKEFPVAAANFIDEHQFSGPLYNHFDWGGYLIWRLPTLPVSIDGRSNLHDTDRIKDSSRVWTGQPEWSSDPELSAARLVVAERTFPLAQLLRLDKRFELVYEDDISAVFVQRDSR